VNPLSSSSNGLAYSTDDTTSSNQTGATTLKSTVGSPVSQQYVEQLQQKIASSLGDLNKLMQQTNGSSNLSVNNSNNAPTLTAPSESLGAEDMAAMLQVLQSKTLNQQLNAAKQGLQLSSNAAASKNTEQLGKIKEWVGKCQDAAAKAKANAVLGWVSKIAGFVAALVATVAAAVLTVVTAGAAAPLLACACIALATTGMSLASQISISKGGPEISVSNLLNTVCQKVFEGMGMSKEDATKYGHLATGIIGIATGAVVVDQSVAGNLGQGIAEVAGANQQQAAIANTAFTIAATIAVAVVMVAMTGGAELPAQVGQIAAIAGQVGKVVNSATMVTQGALTAAQGGVNIAVAYDKRDAANAQAKSKEVAASLLAVQQKMDEQRDEIKKIMEQIDQGFQQISKMFANQSDTMKQITSNFGGQAV